VEHPLVTEPLSIQTLPAPPTLTFFLGRPEDEVRTPDRAPAASSVAIGDEVKPGQVLGSGGEWGDRPSPVAGKVTGVRSTPDIRGGKPGLAVIVEADGLRTEAGPSDGAEDAIDAGAHAFPPLDPATASDTAIRNRIREAGVLTNAAAPRPLGDALADAAGSALVVAAIDREPTVSATLAAYDERPEAAAKATRLLARAAGAARAVLAVPAPRAAEAARLAGAEGVEVLSVPPVYPESLQPLVARRAGAPDALVVPLEAALAALEAVAEGRVPSHKIVTVVDPSGTPRGNYRAPLGSSLAHVFFQIGLHPGDRDKIVAGGPMRGFAQYSLDSALDPTIDALLVLPHGAYPTWSDEPCISCGACVDVCPNDLQAQWLGRCAEFGAFERTREYDIDHCIECGLCAEICPAHRPLLQFIRLAKRELAAAAAPAPPPGEPPVQPDPLADPESVPEPTQAVSS
jgi:electron transport complex protein RnfC